MAKTVESKKNKTKAPGFKDQLYDAIGSVINSQFGLDAFRVKAPGITDCIVVTKDGVDFTIPVVTKKINLDYEADSILSSYLAQLSEPE